MTFLSAIGRAGWQLISWLALKVGEKEMRAAALDLAHEHTDEIKSELEYAEDLIRNPATRELGMLHQQRIMEAARMPSPDFSPGSAQGLSASAQPRIEQRENSTDSPPLPAPTANGDTTSGNDVAPLPKKRRGRPRKEPQPE